MPLLRSLFLLLPALAATAIPAAESVIRSQEHAFRAVAVARGLEFPWSLAFLPDGRRGVWRFYRMAAGW